MAKVTHQKTPLGVRFETACKELSQFKGRVGWFESAHYPDEAATPVAYVAAINEFGSPSNSIPPRPFMRTTEAAELPHWKALAAAGAKACLNGRVEARAVMEGLTEQARGDIDKTISNIFEPPLSPVTLLLRKWRREGRKITGATVGEAARALASDNPPDYSGVSTKPLNDTGYMKATLSAEVTKE